MTRQHNPQQEQMSDESMLRNLAAQAEAIWPRERALIQRYPLPEAPSILDLGCGPGEISQRLLELLPGASLLGLDLDAGHLALARQRCAAFGDRAAFEEGDAVELALEDDRFDLTVCRHLLQAVPHAERVVANLARVTRPGGTLHVLAEDYGMMHFWPATEDLDAFWRDGPVRYAAELGTDLLIGRKVFSIMRALGLVDVRVEYIVVDSVQVDRELFAQIWSAWRDGYTDVIATHARLDRAYVATCFQQMIDCIRNPDGYAVWQVPIISARVP